MYIEAGVARQTCWDKIKDLIKKLGALPTKSGVQVPCNAAHISLSRSAVQITGHSMPRASS